MITAKINSFLRKFMGVEIRKVGQTDLLLKQYRVERVIDIGSNEGQFALHFRRLFKDAEIFCFEPIPDVYQKLKKNVENDEKVFTHCIGLGSQRIRSKISVSSHTPSSSLIKMSQKHKEAFPTSAESSYEVLVSIKCLDDFELYKDSSKILVKMDVQGFELEVIKGGQKTLSNTNIIIVETCFEELYEGQPLFDDIYMSLKDLGFNFHGTISEITHPINGEILYADSLFIKNDFKKS